MWQILKSELDYNKYVLGVAYAIILAITLTIMILDCCGGVYSVVPNTVIPFFIAYGFICQKSCKESRVRQHCMLPQSQTGYGVTRMLFFVVMQSGMLLLWLVAYFQHVGETPQAIWMILSASALMLTFRAVGFIFEDTKSKMAPITTSEGWTAEAIAQRVLRFVTYSVIVFMLMIVASAASDDITAVMEMNVDWRPLLELRDFLRGPMGALATNAALIVLFYLSATFSLPRRSFVSSR